MLQRIEQGSGIFFALAAFRHQTLDQRAQLIGGGTAVVRRHVYKALRRVLGCGAGDGIDIERRRQVVRCRMRVGSMRSALHLSERVRYGRELLLNDVQSRKLILRLNEMIDNLANVRLDQVNDSDVRLSGDALEHFCELLLELIEALTDRVEAVVGPDVGERLLYALGDFRKAVLEPGLIDRLESVRCGEARVDAGI